MANGEPSVVLEGYSYLECPRWHEGRLWVSDFYTHRVLATDGGGSAEVVAEVPNQPAGLGWTNRSTCLLVDVQ